MELDKVLKGRNNVQPCLDRDVTEDFRRSDTFARNSHNKIWLTQSNSALNTFKFYYCATINDPLAGRREQGSETSAHTEPAGRYLKTKDLPLTPREALCLPSRM